MDKLDYKKAYKELYQPPTKPVFVDVPQMMFIAVEGKGDPNTSADYKEALELLYGLSYTIKMSKMSGAPEGYFEYVVPPLEGLWWVEDEAFDGTNITDKSRFCWISMIRQPEFVTEEVFAAAIGFELDVEDVKLQSPANAQSGTAYLAALDSGLPEDCYWPLAFD